MSFFPPINQNFSNNQQSNNPMSISDFINFKKIGEGAHGYVYQAQYKKDGLIYAVKFQEQQFFDSQEKEINYFRERQILYDLTRQNHPHIVKLYADFQDSNYRYLVMELLEGTFLHELKGDALNRGYVNQNLVINIITQLLETLKYLHDTCHIIHRDIKPDNIILEKNGNIKLMDFGLSAYIIHQNKILVSNNSFKAARRFAPPEIILYPPPLYYDYKIDVFSLGFTIHSLMNPCEGKNYNLPQETHGNAGNIRRFDTNLINNYYQPWLIEFVSLLYCEDPAKRPTAAKALGFLKQLLTNPNMAAIYNQLKLNKRNNTNNINTIFRRESFGDINIVNPNPFPSQNNNMPKSTKNIDAFNRINNPEVNRAFNRFNSDVSQKVTEAEEFLQPNMGKENRIISSMKCVLYIIYKLDCFNYIKGQLEYLFKNPNLNLNHLILFSFYQMMDNVRQMEVGQINKTSYDQIISDFIKNIFINNNSGISGARPIILFYMMVNIFKDEFLKNFNDFCQNNIYDYIIQNNFKNFQNLLPLDNQDVLNTINKNIFSFKNQYKGPFVDNFYFIILFLSKCPQCNNLFGISDFQISTFLQLDVPNQENNITDLVNNFFIPKPGTGNYNCKNCGCQGKKLRYKYCLNLPNYLFLELEDKNKINFTDKISVPLYNGQYCSYQFNACIYKSKINDISSFGMILKMGDSYYRYFDDKIIQYSSNINLDFPSLALYKRIFS